MESKIEPNSFFIVLSNKCNLGCKHCYDLKLNQDMSPDILDLATKHVIKKINSTDNNEYLINYVGGEIGLYNQELILDSIHRIKENCSNKKLRFAYQSNFVYILSEQHLSVLKEIDEVGTSYDFKIRFSDFKQYLQWIDNLKTIQSLNKPIRVTTVLTKQVTEELSPQSLLELMVALNIHYLEVNVCYSKIGEKGVNSIVRPLNEKVREYYFELFKLYSKLRKVYDIFIPNIDCLIDSYYGKNYWEHGRHCSLDNETITPSGNVAGCILTRHKPMFNLKTGKVFAAKEDIYNDELQLEEICKTCKYLKYCKGGCQMGVFDETGCPVPYKILEYVSLTETNYV